MRVEQRGAAADVWQFARYPTALRAACSCVVGAGAGLAASPSGGHMQARGALQSTRPLPHEVGLRLNLNTAVKWRRASVARPCLDDDVRRADLRPPPGPGWRQGPPARTQWHRRSAWLIADIVAVLLGRAFLFCPRLQIRPRSACWRKGWDSNPRGSVNPLAVFKTAALSHSATLPNRPDRAIAIIRTGTAWQPLWPGAPVSAVAARHNVPTMVGRLHETE